MLVATRRALCLALAGSILVLAGCGGSGGDSSTPTVAAPPTLQQRTDAATSTVANNAACTSITSCSNAACTSVVSFYWEIGDANGLLASGTGGSGPALNPDVANDHGNGTWTQEALHHASSADGLTGWTQDPAPLRRLTDFAWTQREIRSPHAILDGTTLRLYFAGDDIGNTNAWGIGQMTCSLAPP